MGRRGVNVRGMSRESSGKKKRRPIYRKKEVTSLANLRRAKVHQNQRGGGPRAGGKNGYGPNRGGSTWARPKKKDPASHGAPRGRSL